MIDNNGQKVYGGYCNLLIYFSQFKRLFVVAAYSNTLISKTKVALSLHQLHVHGKDNVTIVNSSLQQCPSNQQWYD